MNERIKKIGKTAGFAFIEDSVYGQRWYSGKCGMDAEEFEKFAELIVRECIDKITTYDLVPGHSAKWEDIYDIHARLLQDLGEELKEHFGVES